MIPAPFDYVRADSVQHALELLAEHGDDAKLLAGGQSLLPMMKVRLAMPGVLIDLGRVPELRGIGVDGDQLVIGAMTTHAEVAASPWIAELAGLLAHAAGEIGDPQIRNRGTIGGSLAHADSAADLPATLVALAGSMRLTGPNGTRTVPAQEFFVDYFTTALAEDELLTAVLVPCRPDAGWGYQKFTRRANDWGIVTVATCAGRIALGNMGPTPIRALAAERALAAGATVAEAASLADAESDPTADMHATKAFRRHLARVLTRRALAQAAADIADPGGHPSGLR